MNLKECYVMLGGDYDEVLARLYSEDMIRRFLNKFLNDGTYRLLLEQLSLENYLEAFRAAHTLKGICDNLGLSDLCKSSSMLTEALRSGNHPENLPVLKTQVCTDYVEAVSAIQMIH